MKIEKIYFDLDGVLSDFWGGLKEMCGEVDTSEMDNVWNAIRPVDHYYYKLKPIEGSIDLIHRCIEKYGDRCEILSAIPSAKKNILYAEEDKRAWVAEYISPEIKVNIVQRAEKAAFCKGPGCVLIDDFPKNVDEWRSLGGTAFLFDKSMTEEERLNMENTTELKNAELNDAELKELTDDELMDVAGGKREHYEKPSTKRKKKGEAARKRARKY